MAAFKLFDKDGSGQISVSEIGAVLSGSGKKVPKKITKAIMQ
jgi:Ca2+-binding EF-hand superfamily protein